MRIPHLPNGCSSTRCHFLSRPLRGLSLLTCSKLPSRSLVSVPGVRGSSASCCPHSAARQRASRVLPEDGPPTSSTIQLWDRAEVADSSSGSCQGSSCSWDRSCGTGCKGVHVSAGRVRRKKWKLVTS